VKKGEKFEHPPLREVAFEINFDAKLIIEENIAKFQDQIIEDFPEYSDELAISTVLPEGLPENLKAQIGGKRHVFENKKRTKMIRVSNSKFNYIVKDYQDFENYLKEVQRYCKNFCDLNAIKKFNRIGLRYINNIAIPSKNGTYNITDYVKPVIQMDRFDQKELITFISEIRLRKVTRKLSLRTGLVAEGKWDANERVGIYALDLDCYSDSESEPSNLEKNIRDFHGLIEDEFLSSLTDKYVNIMRTGVK